jgi:hypothetical protein
LVPVTVLLGIAFVLMSRVPVGQAILAAVWIGHVVYFGFVVKTEKPGMPSAEGVSTPSVSEGGVAHAIPMDSSWLSLLFPYNSV